MTCCQTMYTLWNKLTATAFFVISAISLNAQDFDLASMIFQDNEIEYMGQLDWKQKNKNGTGIHKDGNNVYFGDFFNDKKSGYGMLIAGKKGKIKGVKDCMVYIGSWLNGKKHGKGTCYDFNGEIIYQGKFEEDKPLGEYPLRQSSTTSFSMLGLEGGAYIGEITAGIPNGYGLFVANDGELSFGKIKDGSRYGTSLLLTNPYTWKLVKWTGDSYTEVTNSNAHNAKLQAYKDANDRHWASIKSEFTDVMLGLASSTTQLVAATNGGANSSVYTPTSSSSSAASTSSAADKSSREKQNSSVSGKSFDCGTAWQTASRNYSSLESRVMECCNKSEYNSLQKKMREIRKKWTDKGCHITQSEWETKSFEDHVPTDVTNF